MSQSIRDWYRERTRGAIRVLWCTGLASLVAGALIYWLVPAAALQHLQTFNGALTVPLAGGIWIVAFLLVWLMPMREVSFRGQEAMDQLNQRFDEIQRRVDATLDRVDRALGPDGHETLERVVDHMAAIRAAIERQTAPIPVRRRQPDDDKIEVRLLGSEAAAHDEAEEILGGGA